MSLSQSMTDKGHVNNRWCNCPFVSFYKYKIIKFLNTLFKYYFNNDIYDYDYVILSLFKWILKTHTFITLSLVKKIA